MALQGTLDTFALPDVLRLLASTKKSGRLLVRGNRGDGSLWFDAGSVVASSATGAGEAAGDGEVVFELLRFADGSFTFEGDSPASDPHAPAEIEPLLVDAEHLLDEWREIEALVPSLDHWVTLASTLATPEVTLAATTWRHVVAVGGGTSVHGLGGALGLGELDVCRIVRTLVESGLVTVDQPRTAPVAAPVVAAPEVAPAPVADEPAGRPARLIDLEESSARSTGYTRTLDLPGETTAPTPPTADDYAIEIPGVDPIPTPAPTVAADPVPAPARQSRTAAKPIAHKASAAPEPSGAAHPDADLDVEPAEADEVARQLASLSPKAARAVAAAARAGTAEERDAALAEAIDGEDEPINRGLLLKFLSSVRT